jgi:hypothetical protein
LLINKDLTIIPIATVPSPPKRYNLIGNTSGATVSGDITGNQTNVDPLLGPLQDNGGPTQTQALMPGSPAIDKGSSGGSTTDQCGFPRPIDNSSMSNAVGGDIGAYEDHTVCVAVVTNNNDSGPSLAPFGIADALANPTLEIHDASNDTVATNDNWRTTQIGGLISGDQSAEISASQLAPSNDLESAIIANLVPGSYTAVVRGLGNTVGTGVVDAFDLNAASPARLANIATRGLIQPGDKLMIAGFIVQNGPVRAVVRAIGPSLLAFGIANALPDTILQLGDSNGAIVLENDDWKTDQQQELENTGLQPTNDLEAALVTTLQPGQYTAQVRGKDEATGIGVVQVYFLQ